MWGQNPSRSFSYPEGCEIRISTETVGGLEERWHFATEDVVSATPAISGNTAYVGDWSGRFYALDLQSGEPHWTYRAEEQPRASFGQITASAAVAKVNGTDAVFFGAGRTFYALRASDGEVVWEKQTGSEKPGVPTQIESSPVVAGGKVLFSTDLFGEEAGGYRAGLHALDAKTGEEVWHFDPEEGREPRGCGDVWSSPAVDTEQNTVYVGTGNCFEEEGFGQYSEAIVALDLEAGEPLWSYQPHEFNGGDLDFAGAPDLIQPRTARPLSAWATRTPHTMP